MAVYLEPREIRGTGRNDILTGDFGDNTLLGRNGDDTLLGGRSNEKLFGGKGRDVLNGGEGSNELTGGDGNDTFQIDASLSGSFALIHDFDNGRQERRMIYSDKIEILNAEGRDIEFVDMDGAIAIRINGELFAEVRSSDGPLSAEAVMAATVPDGEPASFGVWTPDEEVIGLAPDARDVFIRLEEGQTGIMTRLSWSTYDDDSTPEQLQFQVTPAPGVGLLEGDLLFINLTLYEGSSLTYTVTDQTGLTDTATITWGDLPIWA